MTTARPTAKVSVRIYDGGTLADLLLSLASNDAKDSTGKPLPQQPFTVLASPLIRREDGRPSGVAMDLYPHGVTYSRGQWKVHGEMYVDGSSGIRQAEGNFDAFLSFDLDSGICTGKLQRAFG